MKSHVEWNCYLSYSILKQDASVDAETNSGERLQKFWNNFKENAEDVMEFLLSPPTIAGVHHFLALLYINVCGLTLV